MPPKRQSPNSSSSSGNPSKKPKTDNNDAPDQPEIPRSDRWSKVSATANADMEYKLATRDPQKAYSYICQCKPLFERPDYDDEEDEDEEDEGTENGNEENKTSCDGGKTCVCSEPAAEHPEHTLTITNAGFRKYIALRIQTPVRCPDTFQMYTYNDHLGYGIMELVQNLLLDFDEAKATWKEQWSICEATAMFFFRGDVEALFGVDDSPDVTHTCRLVLTMFLTMLATLERNALLKPDSEVQNLGMVIALYIRLAGDEMPTYSIDLPDLAGDVLAYATKFNIEPLDLSGMENVDEVKALANKVVLPACDAKNDAPWEWTKSLKEYQDKHKPEKIGGDRLDITTWKSADRKKHSFTKKDPVDKQMIDALKEGLVMQLA